LLVVLTGFGQLGTVGARERLQLAVAPAVLVGDEGDATGVADQQHIAALAPFAFQLGNSSLTTMAPRKRPCSSFTALDRK
jgi:hypothetical protein